MNTKLDDQLVLAHLALIDMERVMQSIEYLRNIDDSYLKSALFRDAVISYAKPFSSNRFSDKSDGLRIHDNHVPTNLKDSHNEILVLRKTLIAHTDMTVQQPKIEKYQGEVGDNFSLTCTGYETLHKDHLIEPLLSLAKGVHASLLRSRHG